MIGLLAWEPRGGSSPTAGPRRGMFSHYHAFDYPLPYFSACNQGCVADDMQRHGDLAPPMPAGMRGVEGIYEVGGELVRGRQRGKKGVRDATLGKPSSSWDSERVLGP